MSNGNIKVLCIEGMASSGKTQQLAAFAQEQARDGLSVLAVAASAGGALRLQELLGNAAQVTSAKSLAAKLLASEELASWLGYEARLMTPAEDKVFFEDLKTSGIKPMRLRKMTSFFERTYSDLGEQADDFPYEWEETGMLKHEEGYLKAYGVTTLERATCAIYRVLEDDGVFASKAGFDCVVVDDFQLLGRAMQGICSLLAKKSLAVAVDDAPAHPSEFRFPYAKGVEDLTARFGDVEVLRLGQSHASKAVCKTLSVLRADEGMGLGPVEPAPGSCEGEAGRLNCASPAAEFDMLCQLFKKAHEDGVAWRDMALSSASEVWLANAASSLVRAGIPLAFVPGESSLSVSFKSEKRNDAARLASMLALAANPNDNMALRIWCGFGSYTANSAVFMRVHHAALEDGLSIAEVLRAARNGDYPKISKLADTQNVLQALEEAEFALGKLEGLRGRELLETAAKLSQVNSGEPAPQMERLLACGGARDGLTGDEDAAALFALVERALRQPVPSAQDGLLCAMPHGLAGFKPRILVFCGAVNGILPKASYFDAAQLEDDKRERMRRKDDAALHLALSRATERVYVTGFADIGLEQAERLGLEVHRIRAEHGRRIARVLPSVMLEGIEERQQAGELR